MRLFRSLLAKYMMIIILAIFLMQLVYLILAVFVFSLSKGIDETYSSDEADYEAIEKQWHEEGKQLQGATVQEVQQLFEEWKDKYADASMFWVNQDGDLVTQLDVTEELPAEWTPEYTARFIKERYDGDPFTVIAFVGNDESNGFIVFEIPREVFKTPLEMTYDKFGAVLLIGSIIIIFLFIFLSFLFFKGIRKRLLHLQEAMEIRDVDGLPVQIEVNKQDEIGRLQQAFNQMVDELRESKLREQEEEQLRKELIANLSHDLRTPLTKINAQIYELEKADMPASTANSLTVMERSIADIDKLIENLMSYTLLMASKYKLDLEERDVIRSVRESLATWYPAFEKEGFTVEVEIGTFKHNNWLVDPIWFNRILDNLLQNVLRHANSGKYLAVKTESTAQYDAFIMQDKGNGMKGITEKKGAGIGLSIVDMMVKGMEMDWEIHSNDHGTMIKIIKWK
nr:HAMP domain-containing sensor histidine kinase [Gracilibacillus ureilyticus]